MARWWNPCAGPRREEYLSRPLTAERDRLIHQEFLRRNDLAANVFLLLGHPGMHSGEGPDLSRDCLRAGAHDLHSTVVAAMASRCAA